MLLLGEQDFAATGHDSFDANAIVMVTLRQATSDSDVPMSVPNLQCLIGWWIASLRSDSLSIGSSLE
jgi:hypothetical protein